MVGELGMEFSFRKSYDLLEIYVIDNRGSFFSEVYREVLYVKKFFGVIF